MGQLKSRLVATSRHHRNARSISERNMALALALSRAPHLPPPNTHTHKELHSVGDAFPDPARSTVGLYICTKRIIGGKHRQSGSFGVKDWAIAATALYEDIMQVCECFFCFVFCCSLVAPISWTRVRVRGCKSQVSLLVVKRKGMC